MFIIKKDKNLIKVLVLFLYSIFYINILEIPISIFYHSWLTPNGHLELVPAFLYSLYSTLHETDTSLGQTLSTGPKGVRLRKSWLYSFNGWEHVKKTVYRMWKWWATKETWDACAFWGTMLCQHLVPHT